MPNTTDGLEVGFSKMVERYLEKYLALHNGSDIPPGLYYRVLAEVERTLFDTILGHSKGNHLKAAKILGINRNTLRKKIINLGEKDIKRS
jgi:two-component system nitrogen regulation response regulator GlnG